MRGSWPLLTGVLVLEEAFPLVLRAWWPPLLRARGSPPGSLRAMFCSQWVWHRHGHSSKKKRTNKLKSSPPCVLNVYARIYVLNYFLARRSEFLEFKLKQLASEKISHSLARGVHKYKPHSHFYIMVIVQFTVRRIAVSINELQRHWWSFIQTFGQSQKQSSDCGLTDRLYINTYIYTYNFSLP